MKHQNGKLILIFWCVLFEKDVMSLKPKCTVDEVLLGSGPFANENVRINVQARRQKRLQASLPDICDDGTIAAKRCSDHEKSFFKNFRTINGECNNLENPLLGSSFSKLSRLLPPEHSKFNKTTYFIKPDKPEEENYVLTNDKFCRRNYNLESTNLSSAKEECKQNPSCVGFYHRCGRGRQFKYCKTNTKITHSSCGSKLYMKESYNTKDETKMLPNARRVSLELMPDKDRKDKACSHMAIFFGQFLDHDISFSPERQTDEDCCKNDENKDSECYEIILPADDPVFSLKNHTCLHLTRSVPHCSSFPDEDAPPSMEREQQNILTSYVDASQVYGSVEDHSRNIRTMIRGKLKISEDDFNLLPEDYVAGCKIPIGGEERAMENPPLASLHALMVREHNRICDRIWFMSDWTKYGNSRCENDACDEILYQNVRRIVIAEYQNIVYSEWLPIMLGKRRMRTFELGSDEKFQYDKTVDPSILASFSTAAFRFGHSMIDPIFTKINPITGDNVKNVTVSDTLFDPTEYEGTGMEMILKGMQQSLAQARDRFVTEELSSRLFKDKEKVILEDSLSFGQDLNARNIARGRDHGIPGYGKFMQKFGRHLWRSTNNWEKTPANFWPSSWRDLEKLYMSPNDIDLYTGGLFERRIVGEGPLGFMFGYIIAEQFRRLKYGDRFFFTNVGHEHSFSTEAMNTIKTRRLSDLLCDNTLITTLGSNVFLTNSPRMNCGNCTEKNELKLEQINLLLPSTGDDSTSTSPLFSFGSFGSFGTLTTGSTSIGFNFN